MKSVIDSLSDDKGRARAERRQLTVMFCDIVDSVSLSQQLDPEDLADVLNNYRDVCNSAIEEFGGFLARYLGDGILIYFGYPKAHEDDAECSVRAALEIAQRVSRIRSPHLSRGNLRVRIGIATGAVLAGNIFGDKSHEEDAVLGETPNLAARLQAIARPGSVVVSAATQQLLTGRFVFEDLGIVKLKGISQPVKAFRVIRVDDAPSRFDASATKGLSPMVSREAELDLLTRLWMLAQGGQGQTVMICGDAGIGKSRLVREFRTGLGKGSFNYVELQCSSYHENSALRPIVEHLTTALGIDRAKGRNEKLQTLKAALDALGLDSEDHRFHLGWVLGILPEDPAKLEDIEPDQVRREVAHTLLKMFDEEARRQPILIVVEDVHWCDPSTLEFLSRLMARLAGMRAMVITTFRPHFMPPWRDEANVTQFIINKLGANASRMLVESIAGSSAIPSDIIDEILAKSDGVPLYVEELTRWLVDREPIEGAKQETHPPWSTAAFEIPNTLQDSLIARLDQLPNGKDAAQIASLLGRSCSYAMLSAIWGDDENSLQHALSELVRARVLRERGSLPESTYEFEHALVQDAACQMLLKRTRQKLHARIAEVMEQRFPEIVESQPEIVAYHWTETHMPTHSIRHWLSAGKLASERSAMIEAVTHFRKGLEVISGIPEDEHRKRVELEFLIMLSAALMATAGPGSKDVQATYTRALELCDEIPQSPLHFAAAWGSWRIAMDFRTGRERADALLKLARKIDDEALILQAHHCQWATLFMLGEQRACCNHIKKGLELYDPEKHFSHSGMYGGHDAKVCALGEAGLSYCLRGYPEKALSHADEALEWAHSLNHAGSIAHALDYAVMLSRYRRDGPSVRKYAEDMIRFAEKNDLIDHCVKGRFFRGYAWALSGEVDRGLGEMRESLETELSIGTEEDFPVYFEMLAEVTALAGRYEESLQAIRQVAPVVEDKGLRYWSAELHRRHAEVLLARSRANMTEAETQIMEALSIAREQDAKLLELRTLCTLVRMTTKSAKKGRLREELHAAIAGFPEESDFCDLREAQALLNL